MIRLIVAYDRQFGIAKQGIMPWHIPSDLAYFAANTKSDGGVILAGSTTFKSFGGPLKDRQNYVLTSKTEPIAGAELVHDLEAFLQPYHRTDKHVWVTGGASVFEQLIDAELADTIYATQIAADFGCSQFFPLFKDHFKLESESDLHEENGFIFTYQIYQRVLAT